MNDYIIEYSLYSIPVGLLECENVRYKIKLLYKIKHLVLVEVFTGNVYKYHVVNYLTKEKKYLFFTKKPIPHSKHKEVAKRIMEIKTLVESGSKSDCKSEIGGQTSVKKRSNSRDNCVKKVFTQKNKATSINKQIQNEKVAIDFLLIFELCKLQTKIEERRIKSFCSFESYKSSA